jgi:hypothetical protein
MIDKSTIEEAFKMLRQLAPHAALKSPFQIIVLAVQVRVREIAVA